MVSGMSIGIAAPTTREKKKKTGVNAKLANTIALDVSQKGSVLILSAIAFYWGGPKLGYPFSFHVNCLARTCRAQAAPLERAAW